MPSATFTSSGTHTVATGLTVLRQVTLYGGGGGGGRRTSALGGGGGSGERRIMLNVAVTSGEALTVTIGGGGAGQAGNGAGTNGGETSLKRSATTLGQANGGYGGATLLGGAGGSGGSGGSGTTGEDGTGPESGGTGGIGLDGKGGGGDGGDGSVPSAGSAGDDGYMLIEWDDPLTILTPTLHTNFQSFYAPTIVQVLDAPLTASSSSVPGAQYIGTPMDILEPPLVENAASFPAASVTQFITAPLVASSSAIYAPTLTEALYGVTIDPDNEPASVVIDPDPD